jgi:FkbM family methyltransferase
MMMKQECEDYRVRGRVKIRLYPDSKLSQAIILHDFEMAERVFIRRYLRRGDYFMDIGTNIGLFSLEAAVAVGEKGKVFSFEPNPAAYARLLENVRINELVNVEALQCGMSSTRGTAKLIVPSDGYDAWSSFGRPTEGECFNSVEVPVVTLDEFVQQNKLAGVVRMIKIDVEGWEVEVLTGGRNYLAQSDAPLLQVEFTRQAALNAGSSCDALFTAIVTLGYTLCSYDTVKNCLIVVEKNLDWEYENLYAAKDIHQANIRLAAARY